MNFSKIAENFSAAGQLSPKDVALAKAQGFSTIICNRPDGEGFGQPSADKMRAACAEHGIAFHYVPLSHSGPGPNTMSDFKAAIETATGPVLAYCRSGARSAMLWNSTCR